MMLSPQIMFSDTKQCVFVADLTSAALAATMYIVHNGRRLYENIRVNIFSHRQTRNVPELLLDLTFVLAAGLSLVAEVANTSNTQCT